MTDTVDLGCGAYLLGRSDERWAICWCGCKTKRHSVVCEQKEVSKPVRLVVAGEGDGEMRSDCLF